MAAILKSKMAARYHIDSDGYLALFESPHLKEHLCQVSYFFPQDQVSTLSRTVDIENTDFDGGHFEIQDGDHLTIIKMTGINSSTPKM